MASIVEASAHYIELVSPHYSDLQPSFFLPHGRQTPAGYLHGRLVVAANSPSTNFKAPLLTLNISFLAALLPSTMSRDPWLLPADWVARPLYLEQARHSENLAKYPSLFLESIPRGCILSQEAAEMVEMAASRLESEYRDIRRDFYFFWAWNFRRHVIAGPGVDIVTSVLKDNPEFTEYDSTAYKDFLDQYNKHVEGKTGAELLYWGSENSIDRAKISERVRSLPAVIILAN